MNYDYIDGGNGTENQTFYTIADLIRLGDKYPTHIFRFVGTQYYPNELISWRGAYHLAAIDYSDEPIHGINLANKLRSGLLKTHYGYKGGEYRYNEYDEPRISRYNLADDYKIVGHDVFDNEIVLNTKLDPY